MGNKGSTPLADKETPLESPTYGGTQFSATAQREGKGRTVHTDVERRKPVPTQTYTFRLLTNTQAIVEGTTTTVQTAQGQKYVYFDTHTALAMQDYHTLVCTAVGDNKAVSNAFDLASLSYQGTKRNADGAFTEFACAATEEAVHTGIPIGTGGQLMARVKTKRATENPDPSSTEFDAMRTQARTWTLVWTYRVG